MYSVSTTLSYIISQMDNTILETFGSFKIPT